MVGMIMAKGIGLPRKPGLPYRKSSLFVDKYLHFRIIFPVFKLEKGFCEISLQIRRLFRSTETAFYPSQRDRSSFLTSSPPSFFTRMKP